MFAAQSTALEAVSDRSVATRMRFTFCRGTSERAFATGYRRRAAFGAEWIPRSGRNGLPALPFVTANRGRGIVRGESGCTGVKGARGARLDDDELLLLSRARAH